MKIVLLNPQIDAAHAVPQGLRARGIALVFSTNADEAWRLLKLHESNVDLAILHATSQGLGVLDKIKADPVLHDLPVILSTEGWGAAESAKHQQSPQGANAYLAAPYTESQLVAVIEGVLGEKLNEPRGIAPGVAKEQVSAAPVAEVPTFPEESANGTVVLEPPHELTVSSVSLTSTQPTNPSTGDGEGLAISLQPFEGDNILESSGQQSSSSIPTAGGNEPSSIDIALPPEPAIELSQSSTTLPVDLPLTPPPMTTENLLETLQDTEAEQEMPYLYESAPAAPGPAAPQPPPMSFAMPVGDAVVPGGAAHTPDTETLKKYLLLREQDVAALSSQLRTSKSQVAMLEQSARENHARTVELNHLAQEQKKRLDGFEREKQQALEALQTEMADLRFQAKSKGDKARLLEIQVREANEEIERIKERVRVDIRKIRVREKELENKLEITKKDSEALIGARENKIIELKRKLDLLEFNMDLLQDQYMREKEENAGLRERLAKAAQVVRVAGGLLDAPGGTEEASGGSREKAS